MDSGEVVELVTRSSPKKSSYVQNETHVYDLYKPTPHPPVRRCFRGLSLGFMTAR